jgi:anti-sigma B factor antagonist
VKLDEAVRGDHSVVTLGGMVTAGEAADRLSGALSRAETERSGAIVVDVTEVKHLDSTALGVLVGVVRRIHAAGREVRLVGVGPRIALLLQLTQLDSMFPTHATVPDALAAEHARTTSSTPSSATQSALPGGVALGDRDRHDV